MVDIGVGEWQTKRSPAFLRTTLGSCVGILLYSQRDRIGGLAHILLAEPPPGKIANRGKFARTAIEMVLSDLKKMGVEFDTIRAALFGGASMFQFHAPIFLKSISQDNIRVAKETLKSKGIPVIFEDTGGKDGRTITFSLATGIVLLKTRGVEQTIDLTQRISP